MTIGHEPLGPSTETRMFAAATKTLWMLGKPSALLLFLLLIGVMLTWSRWSRTGRFIVTLTTVALVTVAIFPVGQWLLVPLERRFPPSDWPPVEGVIVLGGAADLEVSAAHRQPNYNASGERVMALLEAGLRYPSAKLVFSGGKPPGASLSSAEIARQFVRLQGFDVSRIMFEDKARNTAQNAVLTKHLADPRPGEQWLLVTSARHMPRAVGAFRQAGWAVVAHPVDFRTTGQFELFRGIDPGMRLSELDLAIKEWTGLLAYWLSGRSSELLPGPR